MSVNSYVYKTTVKNANTKMMQIMSANEDTISYNIPVGDFMITLSTGDIGSLDKYDGNPFAIKTNPDICWYKFNHVIAWFSEKILKNPQDFIENTSVIIPQNVLADLRRDCFKVLKHCIMPDGTYNIDEEYCKQFFPSLHIPFSGGNAYDKYFIDEIRDAKNDIDRLLLTSNEPDVAFIFHIDY